MAERPNALCIIAEATSARAVADKQWRTPHLDGLAQEGARLQRGMRTGPA